jgi:hypothetical protein
MMTEPFIPLSVLSLDIDEPGNGWAASLADRGISTVIDDIGRLSIRRDDARRLFTERAEAEVRKREVMEQQEQQAIARDQAFRSQIWGGVRADHMPSDARPAAVMLQAARESQPRRPSVLQHALSHEDGMVFHSFEPASPGDES